MTADEVAAVLKWQAMTPVQRLRFQAAVLDATAGLLEFIESPEFQEAIRKMEEQCQTKKAHHRSRS